MTPDMIFQRLLRLITLYYQDRKTDPFVEYHDPEELGRRLQLDDLRGLGNWEELFTWVEQYLAYAVKTGHPGYLNRMWAEANLPSVIGEMITALTNTSACTFETAPVSTLMEQYMLATMLELVGFQGGVGQMTTGSSNANMIAMMAARNARLPRIKEEGLFGQPELFAFVNADAHYSMDRAANILGLGTRHLVKVPVNEHGRMAMDALEERLQAVAASGGIPFFVAATAGTTVRGSYDPLPPLLDLRRKYQFWLHVDGAWGGAVIFSDRLRRQYLTGLEQADSFSLDFHKMLGTALMCNVLLFNHQPSFLREVISAGDESYIFRTGEHGEIRDLGTLSLQCGRRVDSLKWFLDWKYYGQTGMAERIEGYLALCRFAEEQILRTPELEMVVPRESFNICFRFRTPASIPTAWFNQQLRERMHRDRRTLVGTGYVNGELVLRLLITNTSVGQPEIDQFLRSVVETGRLLLDEGRMPEPGAQV